jgi:UDP-glucose 4-epimerase
MEGVDYVFLAAALKQVPSCEFFPMEAVRTNIIGAHNVLEEAITHKVKRVVILSTDKAVYPINAMGMSKALMEKTMVATSRTLSKGKPNSTTLCGVRYGNVLYSRGSVLPFFIDQLKNGEVLTVTNFDMTRFLLPLREAVDLVLYTLAFGENGDMYIRKSPACTLETLAKAVTQLFNHKQGYKAVGIRAGEKMHESLLAKEELMRAVDQGNYYRIPPESQNLDYNKYFFQGDKTNVDKIEAYTSENTDRLNVDQTIELLLTLPEIQQELKNHKDLEVK